MSKITAKYNTLAKVFSLEVDNLNPHYADLFAGIESGGTTVLFSNFSCGYVLYRNSAIASEETWPADGTRYVETKEPTIVSTRIYWEPGESVYLRVWFENWGVHIEHSWTLITPLEEPPVELP